MTDTNELRLLHPDKPPFLVTGVPRGGTTACSNALNEHPQVFCAFERFSWPLDLAAYPFDLEDLRNPDVPDPSFIRDVRNLPGDKQPLAAFGNKKPRYYMTLPDLLDRRPAKVVFVYRSPAPTAASWNTRAFNEDDEGWGRGMTGMFAFADFVQMLHCIRSLPPEADYTMVSYEALTRDEGRKDVLDALFRFLDVPSDAEALRSYDQKQRALLPTLAAKDRGLMDFEQEYFDHYGLGELDDAMRRAKMFTPVELLPHIDQFLDRLGKTDFLETFMANLRRYDHQPTMDFYAQYLVEHLANAGERSIFNAFQHCLTSEGSHMTIRLVAQYCDSQPTHSPFVSKLLLHAQACIDRLPDNPGPYLYLGDLLLRIGKTEQAGIAYAKALSAAPGHAGARERLARVKARTGRQRGNAN